MQKCRLPVIILFALLTLLSNKISAQFKVVTGTIVNENGDVLSGATVQGKNSRSAVKTNVGGTFSITLPLSINALIVSFTEHEKQTFFLADKTNVKIILRRTTANLDSVVVVGYGTQRRKDVTSAISSVSGATIKNLPVQNVAEALQGRIAGVEVIKSSGEPGANAQIIIRGVSSLNQANPLYVIDGVQQSGSNINPQDIASIDVLKDASAAAIYGAAAAGGVIIITTKKGTGIKPTINLSSRYGVTIPRLLTLLDKNQFIQFKILTHDQYYSNLNQQQIDTLPNVDWNKQLYNNGIEQNYNLSISGSSPAINYFVSGVYNSQKGVFLDNRSALAGARINTDFKLAKWIKMGEQLNVWSRHTTPVKTGIVSTPFRTVPTGSPYTNNPASPWGGFPNYQAPNLIAQIKTVNFQFPETNFQGNIYAEVKPFASLTFKATFGYTNQQYANNVFRDKYNTAVTPVITNSLFRRLGKYEQFLNAYVLSFDHSYGDHSLNLLAGYEQYSNISSYLQTSATAVSGNSFGYILTSGSVVNVSGGYDPNGLVRSAFARANYDYKKKYFATLTVRRDGNFTVFGPDHQYGVFPAASVGWRLDEEPFIKKLLPSFSLLKLRGSYGELGNSNINPYQFLTTFNLINYQNFSNGAPSDAGYTQEGLINKAIKWETVKETNIGIDGEFLNGKASFSIDYYLKNTTGMLYGVPLPPSFGLYNGVYVVNIGSVQNKGFDIGLGYKDHVGAFTYSINVTGSFNKNKVLNLDNLNNAPIKDGNSDYPGAGNGKWTGQSLTYTTTGLAFGQFYGYKVVGIYKTDAEAAKGVQQPNKTSLAGDLIFKDINGDGKITDLDRTVIGNPYPALTYGSAINLNYKGFDVSMLFNGVAGVDIYNAVTPYASSIYDGGNVTAKVFKTSFLGSNGLTATPRIGVTDAAGGYTVDPNHNYSYANSFFVENGSYLKLKNLQVGYNFANRLLNKAKITNARLYLMANNVFTITKYSGIDPELGSIDLNTNKGTTSRGIDGVNRYPNTRIYSMGIDLTF